MQGYSCQAAVDGDAQVIVAHATTNEQNDAPQLVPMLDAIRRNTGKQIVEPTFGQVKEALVCTAHNLVETGAAA